MWFRRRASHGSGADTRLKTRVLVRMRSVRPDRSTARGATRLCALWRNGGRAWDGHVDN
jgi:hypothetical protein